jgi:hypothetical protein
MQTPGTYLLSLIPEAQVLTEGKVISHWKNVILSLIIEPLEAVQVS